MHPAKTMRNQLFAGVCLTLAIATLIVYWPTTHHGFTNIDDDGYISANPHVQAGLTWPGVVWAFKTPVVANWHPLTMICLMLEGQLYGTTAMGYHLTDLLFHIVNSLLVFLLLNELTGALWRSALVAALFAWHPLHVESVAWAAETKDVLSAFFWLLTLIAYTGYARGVAMDRAHGGDWLRHNGRSLFFYALALFFFACALMSKPMVVTLPFVLILMDYWPLRRLAMWQNDTKSTPKDGPAPVFTALGRRQSILFLILEKLPFFALSLATSVVTYSVQQGSGAVGDLPLYTRVANALTAYIRYISKSFWPENLAVGYPYSHHWSVAFVIFGLLFLAFWSVLFIMWARRRPYLIVGWCWFLGVLFPTIGLVQVGGQSMADRYMYIPSIGLFILVVWGISDLLDSQPHKSAIAALAGILALGACLATSRLQLRYWQDGITLFMHAIQVTQDNYLAYNCLGNKLEEIGRKDDALALYSESVRVEPSYAPGHFNLAMLLLERGKLNEASNHLTMAVQLRPFDGVFQFDLGTFLLQNGDLEAAAKHFTASLEVAPDFASAHNGLAQVLHRQNKSREAVSQYRKALRSWPDYPDALNGLAWIQSTNPDPNLRSGQEALTMAKRACALTLNQRPEFLTTLSAAYAETGQFSNAIVTLQKARDLAHASGQTETNTKHEALLKCYQSNQPFREGF
jgi:tetratricopeptide (TPR) repeat protein